MVYSISGTCFIKSKDGGGGKWAHGCDRIAKGWWWLKLGDGYMGGGAHFLYFV